MSRYVYDWLPWAAWIFVFDYIRMSMCDYIRMFMHDYIRIFTFLFRNTKHFLFFLWTAYAWMFWICRHADISYLHLPHFAVLYFQSRFNPQSFFQLERFCEAVDTSVGGSHSWVAGCLRRHHDWLLTKKSNLLERFGAQHVNLRSLLRDALFPRSA